MKKEDILKAAQNERKRANEYENKESLRSGLVGSLAALIVALLLITIEYRSKGTINIGLVAAGMTAAGTDNLFEGIKLKKTGKVIFGAIELLFAAVFILAFIGQVRGI